MMNLRPVEYKAGCKNSAGPFCLETSAVMSINRSIIVDGLFAVQPTHLIVRGGSDQKQLEIPGKVKDLEPRYIAKPDSGRGGGI